MPGGVLEAALQDAVTLGKPAPDLAAVLDSLGHELEGTERFWAACMHLFGIHSASNASRGPVRRDAERAEALLRGSVMSEVGLRACPDCATLWGFGLIHGIFHSPGDDAAITQLANTHGLELPVAAYVAAAEQGGSLGRLAWGQLRGRGVMAAQHGRTSEAEALPELWGGQAGNEPASNGTAHRACLEGLDAVMPVAAAAIAHQETPVPQPVDLDFLKGMRSEDRQNFALATQLASDGVADGMAAKAEMLFYGRDRVVPGGSGAAGGDGGHSVPILAAGAAMLLLICIAPRCVRCCAACWSRPRAAEVQRAACEARSGHAQVVLTFLVRLLAVVVLVLLWSWAGPAAALGPLQRDSEAAVDLFEEAAHAGHWGSAYALAMIKLDGPNRSEATPWLRQVAENGDDPSRALAQYFQYRWGLGVDKDPRRAGAFLQEAANLGEPNAAVLLAEVHAQASTTGSSEVVPPEGEHSSSVALEQFRVGAREGRLPLRYNVAVLLLRNITGPPEDMPLETCLEIKADLEAVATDMDPTVRLLFAHALRAWEFGDVEGALLLFMLLSEAGSEKAHRSAAYIWQGHGRAGGLRASGLEDSLEESAPVDVSQGRALISEASAQDTSTGDASQGMGEAAAQGEQSCTAEASADQAATFHLVHEGRFCCPGDGCGTHGWLLSEGGLPPVQCAQMCNAMSSCRFMTIYTATGYCQLSSACDVSHPAADSTAVTYEVRRPAGDVQHCGPAAAAAEAPSKAEEAEVPSRQPHLQAQPRWCLPGADDGDGTAAWRCAAAYLLRMAGAPVAGSTPEAVRDEAEASALAAVGLLERLGLPRAAHAWSCYAGEQLASEQGQILCARLEAEAWQGHPRNLTRAALQLVALAEHGGVGAAAAYASLGILAARFTASASGACRASAQGARCPSFDEALREWGAAELPLDRRLFERILSATAAAALVAAAAVACLASAAARGVCRAWRRG